MIEAHIIPEGFFRRLDQGSGPLRLLSGDDFPRRIRTGIYDSGILCADCEPRFGPWDTYAQGLLTDDVGRATIQRHGNQIVGYEIGRGDWQYDPLKLFFVSLLWRASVSSQQMFRRIEVGPFEDVARRMLEQGDPGSPQDFAVALTKSDPRYGRVIIDPFPERIEDVNYVRFYLGLYVAYIKVDSRPGAAWLDPFVLDPGQPLRILVRNYTETRDLPALQRLVTRPQNLKYARGK